MLLYLCFLFFVINFIKFNSIFLLFIFVVDFVVGSMLFFQCCCICVSCFLLLTNYFVVDSTRLFFQCCFICFLLMLFWCCFFKNVSYVSSLRIV